MSHDTVKRTYSVVYVVRPRSANGNAGLCFSLMSKIPSQKPWARDPDSPDLSRSVILDLQDMSVTWADWSRTSIRWWHASTSLPVPRSDTPQWMYRKALQVSSFRSYEGTPAWRKKSQAFTCHMCAEIITRAGQVASLPEDERETTHKGQGAS